MGMAALPFIAMGLSGAGTVASAIGAKKANTAEQREWEANRRQALLAQTFARDRAADAISRGGTAVAQVFTEAGRTKGEQRVAIAGRNFDIGTGTARHITQATDLVSAMDALIIRENARREARGHMIDAFSAGEQAKRKRPPGAGATVAGTLIGGASRFFGQWSDLKNVGAFR